MPSLLILNSRNPLLIIFFSFYDIELVPRCLVNDKLVHQYHQLGILRNSTSTYHGNNVIIRGVIEWQ